MVRYQLVKNYLAEHGGNYIPQNISIDGVWVGKWLAEQKKQLEGKKKSTLTEDKEKVLCALLYDNKGS